MRLLRCRRAVRVVDPLGATVSIREFLTFGKRARVVAFEMVRGMTARGRLPCEES